MKKSLFISLLACLLVALGLAWSWYFPENAVITEQNGLTYYHEKEFGLTVVVSKQPIDLFVQNPVTQTLAEVSEAQKYRVAINGSYFTPTYEHAGLLYLNQETVVPLARRDEQLSAIVSLLDQSLQITPALEFNTSTLPSTTFAFQTGPQLIAENRLVSTAIDNSLNGHGEYQRTLLGFTQSGQTFLAIITTRKTLTEIANKLLSLKLFNNDTISVVNLDGGPSTALYAPEKPELEFRATKYLPIVIGIR